MWDAHLGGIPVCLLGIESHAGPAARRSSPADGPEQLDGGHAVPAVVEEDRRARSTPPAATGRSSCWRTCPASTARRSRCAQLQLEYGAEIGRAVVNFDGPIVFCVVSRYHGGAFVVFSKTLNDEHGDRSRSRARSPRSSAAPRRRPSCSPARSTSRTASDPRVLALQERIAAAAGGRAGRAARRARRPATRRCARRSSARSRRSSTASTPSSGRWPVGSVDRIIAGADLRPYVIDALERGLARELGEGVS